MERVGRAFRAVGKVVASVMAAETGVVERVEDVRRCSGEELGAEFVTPCFRMIVIVKKKV